MRLFRLLRDRLWKRTLRRAIFVENLRQARMGIICLCVLVIPICCSVWNAYTTTQDFLGAPQQKGVAVVTCVSDLALGRGGRVVNGLTFLHLNGKSVVTTWPVQSLDPLVKGQSVEVGYRVGKSGKIEVQWLRPTNGDVRRDRAIR